MPDFPFLESLGIDRDPWQFIKDTDTVLFEQHRRGIRIHWPSNRDKAPERTPGQTTVVKDQSVKSRLRAAYALGNATCDWCATTLLTWRDVPAREAVKKHVRNFRDRYRERWGEGLCAWVMEMTQKGRPHFHLFHSKESNFGAACLAARKEKRIRESHIGDGVETEIVRGGPDYWMRAAWLDTIGKSACVASQRFNAGGIVEMLRSPDAAGRYVSKESGKRHQKKLPEHYEGGLGRWWHLAERWRPVATHTGILSREDWPWRVPLRHIFEPDALTPYVLDTLPLSEG